MHNMIVKEMGVVYVPNYEDNNDDKKLKDHFLLNEFEEKSVTFNEDLNKIIESNKGIIKK